MAEVSPVKVSSPLSIICHANTSGAEMPNVNMGNVKQMKRREIIKRLNDIKYNVQDRSHMGNGKEEGDKGVIAEKILGELKRGDNGELH